MSLRDRLAQVAGNFVGDVMSNAGNSRSVVNTGPVSSPVSYPLDTFTSVVLDTSGNGIASLGPGLPRQHWQPGSAYVSVDTNVHEASCTLSLGSSPQSGTEIAQTSKGSSGATCSLSGDMPSGYRIWAVWSGGDSGATATLHVTGSNTTGSPVG